MDTLEILKSHLVDFLVLFFILDTFVKFSYDKVHNKIVI